MTIDDVRARLTESLDARVGAMFHGPQRFQWEHVEALLDDHARLAALVERLDEAEMRGNALGRIAIIASPDRNNITDKETVSAVEALAAERDRLAAALAETRKEVESERALGGRERGGR